MQRSPRLLARLGGWRTWIPGAKPLPADVVPALNTSPEFDESDLVLDKERRIEDTRRRSARSVEALRLSGHTPTADLDAIAARGFLKTTRNYEPPKDLEARVRKGLQEALSGSRATAAADDWRSVSIRESGLKFRVCELLAGSLGHWVPSSYLHEMKEAGDLLDFYAEPRSNLTDYVRAARSPDLPPNLRLIEEDVAFHPDDTDAWHKGVTALPTVSHYEPKLRHQRLYREFRAKTIKSHFDESGFDYSADGPADAPWREDLARHRDRNIPRGVNSSFLL